MGKQLPIVSLRAEPHERNREHLRIVLYVLGALTCLVFALHAHAGDGEEIPADTVPPEAVTAVKNLFPGAEVVGASKLRDDSKEAYIVTIVYQGSKFDVAAHPHGRFVGRIEPEVALKEWPAFLLYFAVSLLPAAMGAILATRLLRLVPPRKWPLPLEWSLAWLGAVIALWAALFIFLAVTNGGLLRHFILVAHLQLLALGAMWASLVELATNLIGWVWGKGGARRGWIFTFGLIAVACAGASVAVEIYRREQWNRNVTAHALEIANTQG